MTDIGATLREARMRARIDIIEVERATKIRTKYLRAMEDEEWGLLPGPTFVKSFLRTYADYLGLDSRMLVEEWKRTHESPSEHEPAPRPSRPTRPSRGSRGSGPPRPAPPRLPDPPGRWRPFALVGVVIVALLVGLYVLGKLGGGNNNEPATPTVSQANKAKHKAKHKKPKKKAAPTTVKLEVTPTSPVYVCLTDGGGKKLIPGTTLTPGSPTKTFRATKFLMNLGNNGLQIKANGKAVPIAASPTAIGLVITPTGHKPLAAGKRPTCA